MSIPPSEGDSKACDSTASITSQSPLPHTVIDDWQPYHNGKRGSHGLESQIESCGGSCARAGTAFYSIAVVTGNDSGCLLFSVLRAAFSRSLNPAFLWISVVLLIEGCFRLDEDGSSVGTPSTVIAML
jgi:hypothetical protein